MTLQTRLQPGMLAYVIHVPIDPNTVRTQPDTQAPTSGLLHPGVVMEVMAGPVYNDGMIFWQVRSPALAQPGWTSEGNQPKAEYYLAPVAIHPECAGEYPSRLQVGDLVLDYGADGPRVPLTVTDGPFCAAGQVIWGMMGVQDPLSWQESAALFPLVINFNRQPWGRFHVVQPGDTWSALAQRFGFGTDWPALQAKNLGLVRSHDVLEPGDLLSVEP